MSQPETTVRSYLDAMEARDLGAAERHLARGFSMTFPGSVTLKTLPELITWAKDRYTRVSKTYEGFDTLRTAGADVVYCFGTLRGTWLDGTAFSGIRFIDRFELQGSLITKQDVWNDLGEARSHG